MSEESLDRASREIAGHMKRADQAAADEASQVPQAFIDMIREVEADAFDRGFTACGNEHAKQRKDPKYPITRVNPYIS